MSTLAEKLKKRRRDEQEIRGYANSSRWYTGLSNAISFLERAETGTDPISRFSDAWSVAFNLFMMHGEPGDEEYRRFNSWVSTVRDYAAVRHYFVNTGDPMFRAFREAVDRSKRILLKTEGLQALDSWGARGVSQEKACRYFFLIVRDMRNTAYHPEFNPNTGPVKKAIGAAADCLIPLVAASIEATIEHPVPGTTGRATAYRFFLYPFLKNSDGFFSDYYLERLFPDDELAAFPEDQAKDLLKQIAGQLTAREATLRTADAEETVSNWMEPVLFESLGARPTAGVRIVAEEAVFQPSFVLHKEGAAAKPARGDLRGKEAGSVLSCLIWCLPWRASLDSVATEPPFTALPITEVVNRALVAGDVPWGLVTNGRQLRLLSRASAHKPRCFLEADLVALIDRKADQQSLRAFRFLLGLFSAKSFTEVDEKGRSLLDRVAEGSDRHGKEIGDELKTNVFAALQELGEGFLAYMRANPKPTDEWRARKAPNLSREKFLSSDDLLEDIYHESLSLMYRLLFLFYAESRELLPLDDETYRESYSLESLRDEVHSTHDDPDPRQYFAKGSIRLWQRLHELFRLLDKGWGKIIPPYNGGLFDPEQHEFLERFAVSDYCLARAIDLLSRTKPRFGQTRGEGRKKVTYRDLDVRHLGSIYEGILEYTAHIADQDYVILRQGSGAAVSEEYVEVSKLSREQRHQLDAWREATGDNPDNPKLTRGCKVSGYIESGSYYLIYGGRDSKRKSSGSYYTPDYIVQYIVENTLGPLVRGECRPQPEPLTEELKAIGWTQEPQKSGLLSSEEILDLKVLDPAMGSGHFLVGATEYLARAYRDARLAEGAVPDEAKADQEFIRYKRIIAERCIYGVDINPMAVELAKLSMWLFTMDPGRPLSFLDHHFKCGNALLGAWLRDFGAIPRVDKAGRPLFATRSGQANLFDSQFRLRLPVMMQDIFKITSRETVSTHDIADKKQLDSLVEQIKRPYVRLADYWTSAFFGVDARDYLSLLGSIEGRPAPTLSVGRSFFHWELEFPEVFFEQNGEPCGAPGFDAVLGNPPWGAQLDDDELSYFRGLYQRVVARMVDSYIYFIDRSLQLLRPGGALGYIVSSGLLNQTDAWKVRSVLVDHGIVALASLGSGVFGSGVLNTSTIVISRPQADRDSIVLIDASADTAAGPSFLTAAQKVTPWPDWKRLVSSDPHFTFFVGSSGASELLEWLRQQHPNLSSVLDGEIQRGVSPDIVGAHVVSIDEAKAEKLEGRLLKPSISGIQVRRYRNWNIDQFIIYTTRETEIERFPNVKRRLAAFRHDNTCREVAEGKHPWWALHRPRDPGIFKSPKFVGLTTSRTIELVHDPTDSVFVTDAMYVFRTSDGLDPYAVMAVLQSQVFLFTYRVANQGESRIIPQVKASKLQTLPFPTFESHPDLIGKLSTLSRQLYDLNMSSSKTSGYRDKAGRIETQIEELVCRLYGLTDDNVALVRKTLEGI